MEGATKNRRPGFDKPNQKEKTKLKKKKNGKKFLEKPRWGDNLFARGGGGGA